MSAPITVVKIGGSTLGRHPDESGLDDLAALFADGRRFVVVHGGGATITEWLATHNVESRFVRGLRATDERALEVVVAVLAGLVNKRLVAELEARGARALGLSGADGAIIRARRYDPELGFVGQVVAVDGEALRAAARDAIVVLAPIAIEAEGEAPPGPTGRPTIGPRRAGLRPQLLNVNADTAAGEVAAALSAEQLVFLTDVPGVMDGSGSVREQLSPNEARELLDSGVVARGMIPKVESALRAAAASVPASIADGRRPGALRALLAGAHAQVGGTRIA